MNIAVLGLWHLGAVTAACLARLGHTVVGWDPDAAVVSGLSEGRAPIAEPGLDDLVSEGIAAGRLTFVAALDAAVVGADVVWITFDTPVDDDDRADVDAVLVHVRAAVRQIGRGSVLVSSSQLPVGTLAQVEEMIATERPGIQVSVAAVPENLRLGQAVARFLTPDRIVVGVRDDRARQVLEQVLRPITEHLVWMSVESAEMTKHAINAFLATSVAFANEIAGVCERVGADAREVAQGLRSDDRIGRRAYLGPGAAFAGGTLARDLVFLKAAADRLGVPSAVVTGALESNRQHAGWAVRSLMAEFGSLQGRRIGVWGLTYKPDTSTLRRSMSVELCRTLARAGAAVCAFDPAISTMPDELAAAWSIADDAETVSRGADAIVVCTEWPVFRHVTADELVGWMPRPVVLDAGRFLAGTLGDDPRIRYLAVGLPRL